MVAIQEVMLCRSEVSQVDVSAGGWYGWAGLPSSNISCCGWNW